MIILPEFERLIDRPRREIHPTVHNMGGRLPDTLTMHVPYDSLPRVCGHFNAALHPDVKKPTRLFRPRGSHPRRIR
jgi:hypothetical protein